MNTEVDKAKPAGQWAKMTRTKDDRTAVAWYGVILVVAAGVYGLPWAFVGSAAWPFEQVALMVGGICFGFVAVLTIIFFLMEWVEKGEEK